MRGCFSKRWVSVLGLRPAGDAQMTSRPSHLRAEPVNLSFLLMPSVTAFATTSFDESKSRALRLDAFQQGGSSVNGKLGRDLPVRGATASHAYFGVDQSPPPTPVDWQCKDVVADARPKLRRESVSLRDRARLRRVASYAPMAPITKTITPRAHNLHRDPVRRSYPTLP